CQCFANLSGTSAASLAKSQPSVCASSRKRASEAASGAAWPSGTLSPVRPAKALTSRVSSNWRRSGGTAGGRSNPVPAASPSSLRKASSSGSRSPTGTIFGSSIASPPLARRKASRRLRAARRVGSSTVMRASASGSRRARRISPATSVSRNGLSNGIEEIAGGMTQKGAADRVGSRVLLIRDATRSLAPHAMMAQPRLAGGEALRRADMEPLAVMDQRLESARLDRPVPQRIEREGARGRRLEEAPAQNLDPGVKMGRDLALGAAPHPPQRIDHEIAQPVIADRRYRALHQQQRVEPAVVPRARESLQRRD